MRRFWQFAVFIVALGTAACQHPEVVNVDRAPLNAPASASLKDVERAILSAGTKRAWVMRVEAPGHIVAAHTRGAHSATVDIFFNTETYSIVYKDSSNLDYENGRIHGTYNRWVEYLKQDIALSVQTIS
jgi:hypothetical protein